ncbi:16S rRNA (guanine(527)-N(7))-methyltransferase RsmG [Alphaproteobacteria bacterium]|nr:16S rRNA (guanine(527)-N(7))-methyltransferase RsmG [Alphaproteobacteria bacterium]
MNVIKYDDFCSIQYVSRETYDKFKIYYETLIKWQKSINLISNSTLDNIWNRHILDSAQLYKYTHNLKGNILDFGSGAGFPGLVLAMMGNENVNAVESDEKKCIFLKEVARLSDTKINIHNSRIEKLKFLNPELITARALAPLIKLIDYIENYMKQGDNLRKDLPKLLFLKGKNYKQELLELKKIRNFDVTVCSSVSDEYGKVLNIKNISVC